MADADLDVVIRQLARQLHTGLMTRAKERRDRFNGLAAKAKGKDTSPPPGASRCRPTTSPTATPARCE